MLDMYSSSIEGNSTLPFQPRMVPPSLRKWRGAVRSLICRSLYFLSKIHLKQYSTRLKRTVLIRGESGAPHFKPFLKYLQNDFGLSKLLSAILPKLVKTAGVINRFLNHADGSYMPSIIQDKQTCPCLFSTLYPIPILPSLSLFYIFHTPLIKRIHSRYLPRLNHTNLQT
jgi:hypothetical protein